MMKLQHVAFVMVSLCLTLLAKEVWQEKPYAEWTQQEAVAILTDSPWAARQRVRGGPALDLSRSSSAEREGSGTSAETTSTGTMGAEASGSSSQPRFYTVRLISARPVQMAIARWAMLEGRITPQQAKAMLKQDPYKGSVVVSLSASNEQDWSELNALSTEALKEENYLLLKESKRKIFAERYVPPAESGIGDGLLYFPGSDGGNTVVTAAEKEVTFNCRLSDRTRFRTKFKLKEMMFEGELAI